MSTITIGAYDYEVLGSVTGAGGADEYHNGSIGTGYDEWNASADADKKGRCLNSATRILNRQTWVDEAATHALRDAITAFREAAYEMAAAIFVDPDSVQAAATSGSNIASVGAGPASVSFFRPTLGFTGRFEVRVQELIGSYLSGSNAVVSEAWGTDTESAFDDADRYSIDRAI